MATPPGLQKVAFVTVGATASFDSLLEAVASAPFMRALDEKGYSKLVCQFGHSNGSRVMEQTLALRHEGVATAIAVEAFNFKESLRECFLAARSGVVIGHAGSGTILEALRLDVPMIVVPNTNLLDNHQVELADALAEQGYVVHGKLDNLAAALEEIERMRQRPAWPPVNSNAPAIRSTSTRTQSRKRPHGLVSIIDEEVGMNADKTIFVE